MLKKSSNIVFVDGISDKVLSVHNQLKAQGRIKEAVEVFEKFVIFLEELDKGFPVTAHDGIGLYYRGDSQIFKERGQTMETLYNTEIKPYEQLLQK